MKPNLLDKFVYFFCLLASIALPGSSLAQNFEIQLVGGNLSSEPCLTGAGADNPDGLLPGYCAGPRDEETFAGRKSILTLIAEDYGRIDGASAGGHFERVSDSDDQIWQVLNGETALEVRTRSRYQGASYDFGITRIDAAGEAGAFETQVQGNRLVKSKVLLYSCDDEDLRFSSGVGAEKDRCVPFNTSLARFKTIEMNPSERFAFAIREVDLMRDLRATIGSLVSSEDSTQPEAPSNLFSSRNEDNNQGLNQMVAFRYSKEIRFPNSDRAKTVYILAFSDQTGATTFNDFILEVTLAEPAADAN